MGKFFMGVLVGVASAIATAEIMKSDKVKGAIDTARGRIYDAIGELVDKIDPDVTQ